MHGPETGDRIGEEHRSEPGEHEVEPTFIQAAFHIACDEADIADPLALGVVAGQIEEGITAIHADDLAGLSGTLGKKERRVAKAASCIQNAIARADRQFRKDRFGVARQAALQHMPEADEFRREDLVPEVHRLRLIIGRGDLCLNGHVPSFSSSRAGDDPIVRRWEERYGLALRRDTSGLEANHYRIRSDVLQIVKSVGSAEGRGR